MSRPGKPCFAAARVVKASQVLTGGEKWVWWEDYALDNEGPNGSYIAPGPLALRLGMAAGTVEVYRSTLAALGLYVIGARAVSPKGTALTVFARFPVVPFIALPTSQRPNDDDILRCREDLDAFLRSVKKDGLPEDWLSPPKRQSKPRLTAEFSPLNSLVDGELARVNCGGVGGAAPTSAFQPQKTHQPASIKEEAGRSNGTPKAEVGTDSADSENGIGSRSKELTRRDFRGRRHRETGLDA